MALGLPYDSDAGRAYAAAITVADDRPRLRHLGPHRRPHGPVRRLRGQPRAHAPRARHAPGRGGPRSTRSSSPPTCSAPPSSAGTRPATSADAVRRAQLAGLGARAHRHDRPDDGLRHHRHRARPRPVQGQEARRRRHDADRQPDGAPGPRPPRLHARAGRPRSSPTSTSTSRSSARPHLAAEHVAGVRLLDGRQHDPLLGPRADDGGGPAVHLRRHLQDREHARGGHGRGGRAAPHRRLAARREGHRHLPRQLQGRPAALDGQEGAEEAATDARRRRRSSPRWSRRSSRRSSRSRSARSCRATAQSHTFEFRVADCKGFVTSASTTTAAPARSSCESRSRARPSPGSWTPSPSRSSYGLQYGVPLRAYVETFTNTRFEPAGMTDDPDLRIAIVAPRLHLPPPGGRLPVLRGAGRAQHPHHRGAHAAHAARASRRRHREPPGRRRPGRPAVDPVGVRARRLDGGSDAPGAAQPARAGRRHRRRRRPSRTRPCHPSSSTRTPRTACSAASRCSGPAPATPAPAAAAPAAAADPSVGRPPPAGDGGRFRDSSVSGTWAPHTPGENVPENVRPCGRGTSG